MIDIGSTVTFRNIKYKIIGHTKNLKYKILRLGLDSKHAMTTGGSQFKNITAAVIAKPDKTTSTSAVAIPEPPEGLRTGSSKKKLIIVGVGLGLGLLYYLSKR